MTSLDDRLRDASAALDAALPAGAPAPAGVVRRARRRPAYVAALTVVLGAAAVAIGFSRGDGGTAVVTDAGTRFEVPGTTLGPAGSDPAASPGDDVVNPAPLALRSWEGARTSPDGTSLVVAIVGGPPYQAGDPCTVDYEGSVTEGDAEVRLRIVARSPKAAPAPMVLCTSVGYLRLVTVRLAQPLGHRRLIEEQFDREQGVFDGSQLLEPGWLPPGWSWRSERPQFVSSPGTDPPRDWGRTWGPPRPAPADGRCTAGEAGVELVQGPADLVARYPSNGERPVATYRVRGQQATYYSGGPLGATRLAWTEGDRGFVLSTAVGCAGDTPLGVDDLVRVAGSLQPSR